MRVYEELFILKPDAPEEEADAFIGQIKDLITNGKGTIEKADKWGTRKLAYRVQKYNEGVYVLIQFSSSPDLVKEVERRMRVTDLVIKFITVRIDEKAKKIEKRKKLCRFCVDKIDDINYKDVRLLSSFISERGKITPRRISGVCAPHQRRLAESIKQARNIALVPFATSL